MQNPFILKLDEENNLQACRKQETYGSECQQIIDLDDLLDFIRN